MGGLPTGYIIAKLLKKIDIREYGSGNIGATNIARVIGKKWGIVTFLVDFLKGFLPVLFVKFHFGQYESLACGFACVVGHSFPIYIRFRGGKGIATGLGVFVGITPLAALFAFIVWLVVVIITGYVSLGSIIGALCVPTFQLILGVHDKIIIFGTLAVTLLVIWRHAPNIRRLLHGEEHGFRKRKGKEQNSEKNKTL